MKKWDVKIERLTVLRFVHVFPVCKKGKGSVGHEFHDGCACKPQTEQHENVYVITHRDCP